MIDTYGVLNFGCSRENAFGKRSFCASE